MLSLSLMAEAPGPAMVSSWQSNKPQIVHISEQKQFIRL